MNTTEPAAAEAKAPAKYSKGAPALAEEPGITVGKQDWLLKRLRQVHRMPRWDIAPELTRLRGATR
jgi:hypothetical protein